MNKKILLASPHMSEEEYEKDYINEAFETNWIAPLGKNVDKFENEIAKYVNTKSAVALSSGTSAIHMSLKALNIKQNDIVFCSDLTFSASVNPIIYQNAIPVFIDSEYESYNMCPKALEKAFIKYPKCKAVILVHLYGTPANIDEITKICKKYNVPIVEDSAESLGATYKNKQTGSFGKYGVFSFNGNKIITTSGGGAVVTDNIEKAEKIRFWSTQSREKTLHYEHLEIGYNYRMSNVLAGIGIGQLKVLQKRLDKKRKIYKMYKNEFEDIKEIKMQPIPKYTKPNHWLSVMTIDKKLDPIKIIEKLKQENIETRPIWKPMHLQPVFKKYDFITVQENISISENLYNTGICLPSDTKMTEEQQKEVINIIRKLL